MMIPNLNLFSVISVTGWRQQVLLFSQIHAGGIGFAYVAVYSKEFSLQGKLEIFGIDKFHEYT